MVRIELVDLGFNGLDDFLPFQHVIMELEGKFFSLLRLKFFRSFRS